MNLAREFGRANWKKLLNSIGSTTLIQWQHYFFKRGFTHQRADINAALIASTNWNVTTASAGIRSEPRQITDFLPNHQTENSRELSDEEIMNASALAGGTRFE